MEPLGWDDGRDGNNWDLNAVLRSGCRGPMPPPPPPPRTANNPVARYAPPPPPQPAYAATVFADGLGHQAISALPQPQALDQDLPHALRWGPSLDLPPEHQANPPPWPRNEIPAPSVQRPAGKHVTAPSRGPDAAEGSSPSKKRDRTGEAKDSKVVLVLAEDPTPPDSWAWRKYGEKSIKNTPYRRSYYRCCTDKDCEARKQVQRCLTQTSFLAISYIGEHSHPMPLVRNSQAGTTHHKPPPRQPTSSPFIRLPASENQPQAPPAPLAATSPFAKIYAAQGRQQQTPASPASASASMLPVTATPFRIQEAEQPPQAPATTPAPSASPMMPPTIPLVCNCLVCTKAPLPLPPLSVIESPSSSRESQPQAPALLVRVPYSLSPNTTLPPSPLLNIPAVQEHQQTPALPASASASLSSSTPLPPVSPPLLIFQAEELMSPSTLLPPPSLEFDNEEDDDAIAVRMRLHDIDMTPEDALMFVNPEEEPLDGVGDDLLIPTPEEIAAFCYGDEENLLYPMAYEPASAGSGNNSLMFQVPYEAAAALGSSGSDGSTSTGAGAGTAPRRVQPPTATVVNDERLPPLQPADASHLEW